MGNVMAYSGIVTKVHGMQAKLLSEEELEEVASKKTVPEVIEYLKEKPAYAEYMNRLEVKLYHRRNVSVFVCRLVQTVPVCGNGTEEVFESLLETV